MNKDKVNGLGLKAGDRVRIVIEDKVEMAFPSGALDTVCNNFSGSDNQIVSIEKIGRPLPTEPGATFRARVTFNSSTWDDYESLVFVRVSHDGTPVYIPTETEHAAFSGHDVAGGDVTVEVLD